jgi:2-dehydro-3-deoxyphosphogluconate aldolase/(4S)-4-hydroxy-2-oxoglutarate aldolase
MNPIEAAQALKNCGIIAIVRGNFSPEALLQVGHALADGGVRALEITLNTPKALLAISELRRSLPSSVWIGAGTVRRARDVDVAVDAGAQFLISPALDLTSIKQAKKRGTLLIPGIFTATEAQMAAQAGCSVVKLFPADACGPGYLKSLRAPLDDLDFVPTGGITPQNLGDFVRAGAVAFGVGGALVNRVGQSPEEVQAKAKEFVQALMVERAPK